MTHVDLSTTYLGLALRTPIVASSGPFTGHLDGLRALEAAGVAAVVLPSRFEERVVHDAFQIHEYFETGADSNPEASSYAPPITVKTAGDAYVRLVERAKAALEVPVIASLNGVTAGGWLEYARRIEEAGADALELNVYRVAAGDVTAAQVEEALREVVSSVRAKIGVPLAVKLGPFYSAFGDVARRVDAAGADGLVLFNRFYQPDIDVDHLEVRPALALSDPSELRLRLRWVAILAGRLRASLAVTGGVHTGADVAKALLAGADVAMMTSALLRHGTQHIATVERELLAWARSHEYASVAQLKGSMSQRNVAEPDAFERANYMKVLQSWRPDPTSVLH